MLTGEQQSHVVLRQHLSYEPDQVLVGIETDRGPWVQALLAAGYQVWAINPVQAARYFERHTSSGAKSDPGDAHLLAEIVRLDRVHHRPVAGESTVAEHVKVAARAHQTMIWTMYHLGRIPPVEAEANYDAQTRDGQEAAHT